MMKVAIVILAITALAVSAPQPRKVFHEHFEDFLDVIFEEVGEDMQQLMEQFVQYEEFQMSLNYMETNNFRDIVYEMESLPEFQAVIEFLEKDNIDIMYFIDRINEMIDSFNTKARQQFRGKDMTSFIYDNIDLFPKEKLAAVFEQKMAEDEEFRVSMENLQSDEFKQVFDALWKSETFQVEVQTLSEHGINITDLLDEIMAIFGQN